MQTPNSSRARTVMTAICALCVVYALGRIAAHLTGHGGSRVALVCTVISGISGVIGLAASLAGKKRSA